LIQNFLELSIPECAVDPRGKKNAHPNWFAQLLGWTLIQIGSAGGDTRRYNAAFRFESVRLSPQ
jgi:hypothetical protein